MRKKHKIYLCGIAFLIIALCPMLASASVSEAITYLEAQDQNAWITQALVAGGASNIATNYLISISKGMNPTNDYAKAILALAALGENPTTFGNEDYVAKLKTYYNNEQMGDVGLLNDDIWSILALASVYQVNSPEAIAAKNYILDNQNDDGGWGYSTSSGSDTNDTASAIIALVEAGVSTSDEKIVDAVNYLELTQNTDGGFPYDPGSEYGTDSDSGSDAWVIIALNKTGINPTTWDKDGDNPISNLESLQDDEDGGFWWIDPATNPAFNNKAMTSYAIIALANKTFPIAYYNIPEPDPSVNLVIKGSSGIICNTSVQADTALNSIVNSSSSCNFTYSINDTDFGPYLSQINSDTAEGMLGWLYYVNQESPMVGADQYEVSEGDNVLWYFGEWGWENTTLEASGTSEVEVSVLQPVSVTVPSSITDATINVNMLTTDDGTNVTAIVPEITMNVTTSLSTNPVSVVIPEGNIITAPTGWNGIINAPKIEANSSVKVDADSGFNADVSSVIEVGYGDTMILFSKAVRLLIPESAGKDIGYSRNGNFTKITNICSDDSQAVGDALNAGGECKIDIGDDLIIWTKHFTKFATYTQTAKQTSSGGGSSIPITKNYCQEVEYDEWQLDCVDGWQYRDVLLITPPACSLTQEQEDLRKKQCIINTEKEEVITLELNKTEVIKPDILEETVNTESEIVGSVVTSEADIIATGDINLLLSRLVLKRNIALELNYNKTIIKKIITNLEIDNNIRFAISNFITYGSKTTLDLGAGERAGVINSFLTAFGNLPSSSKDWDDIIKIANGNLPKEINTNAEEKARAVFKDIFLRDADENDELIINMISYGARPIKRDLEKERKGLKLFQSYYNHNPVSAKDWDLVRAISYSNIEIK